MASVAKAQRGSAAQRARQAAGAREPLNLREGERGGGTRLCVLTELCSPPKPVGNMDFPYFGWKCAP